MRIAANVFRTSQRELSRARWCTTAECGTSVHSFVYDDRRLEVRLVREALAIEVRCDEFLVEALRVKEGALVDRQDTRIAEPATYFGFLILGFVAPDAPSTLN